MNVLSRPYLSMALDPRKPTETHQIASTNNVKDIFVRNVVSSECPLCYRKHTNYYVLWLLPYIAFKDKIS